MRENGQGYGSAHRKAPAELARFAFLLGEWRCTARLLRDDGTWGELRAKWEGRYILDGLVIADEFQMTNLAGEVLVLGMNFRSFDAATKTWQLRWLNAFSGTWTDLGPPELGGVQVMEDKITYCMKEPLAAHSLTRATYAHISPHHFTWRGERSHDGAAWEEFLVIEAARVAE